MAGRILFDDATRPSYYARRRTPAEIYQANRPYLGAERESYLTQLSPQEESEFQAWVQRNGIPFDPSPEADYDMRGFFRGLRTGDPHAVTGKNQNDNMLHFSDWWKTPFHESFSVESQFANPNAPQWNEKDQLVTPQGKVLFDERALQRYRESGFDNQQ